VIWARASTLPNRRLISKVACAHNH